MKITHFGASGSIGREFIKQTLALADDHQITAITRGKTAFGPTKANLQILEGDVIDRAMVEASIAGADAVVVTLGTPLGNTEMLRKNGTANVVKAMAATGVKRLICLSAHGAGDSYPMLPALYRYALIPLMMRNLYADHNAQEEVVRKSTLDWTLVRPAAFVKGQRTGSYWHGAGLPPRPIASKISRADVADFLVRQLSDTTYVHQSPSLSYLK